MKRIALITAVLVVLSVFTACGAKAECDFCGETKRCEERSVLGETVNICGDCVDELEELGE